MEEEFKVTDEELEKFGSAMKKQEFRDLLVDYVKEIQDPENKKRYEEEIVELERRRGQNVKFINPKPGFVLKIYLEPGRRKIYVNICTSDVVAEATSTPAQGVGSKKKSGADWSVPYTLTSPRDDLDKSGKRCKVYDCVFHPNTYEKGEKYLRFKQLLVETAVGAVEKREGGRASPDRVKILSMAYKGVVQPAIFRDSTEKKRDGESDPPFGVAFPPLPKTSKKKSTSQKPTKPSSSSPSEPVYTVKYRGEVAMGDFTNERVSQVVRRPNEIVVAIELPGLTSAGTVVLDVTEKQLILDNKDPAFHLDVS